MAKRLKDKQPVIDAWISSPAKRAKKTAEIFTEIFQAPSTEIILISALYHAPAEIFYESISALADNLNRVAVFSHNPGITYFVNSLVPDIKIDNMPTCGIFTAKADISRWGDFASAKKEFIFFDYPKR